MVTSIYQDNVKREKIQVPALSPVEHEYSTEPRDRKVLFTHLDEDFDPEINEGVDIRCLQDMLEESQSDSHTDSENSEVKQKNLLGPENNIR